MTYIHRKNLAHRERERERAVVYKQMFTYDAADCN